ncbi:MAG: hypothetical protein E6G79_00230 [Alphaproteobacteria bacterium]|nr:MAG: hypothetical protein E6G79_00230 [Alphaproteobacteria bacterium]
MSLFAAKTELRTNASRTIQHPAATIESIHIRRRVMRFPFFRLRHGRLKAKPRDYLEDRTSSSAGNLTRALSLILALRVNSGTQAFAGATLTGRGVQTYKRCNCLAERP